MVVDGGVDVAVAQRGTALAVAATAVAETVASPVSFADRFPARQNDRGIGMTPTPLRRPFRSKKRRNRSAASSRAIWAPTVRDAFFAYVRSDGTTGSPRYWANARSSAWSASVTATLAARPDKPPRPGRQLSDSLRSSNGTGVKPAPSEIDLGMVCGGGCLRRRQGRLECPEENR